MQNKVQSQVSGAQTVQSNASVSIEGRLFINGFQIRKIPLSSCGSFVQNKLFLSNIFHRNATRFTLLTIDEEDYPVTQLVKDPLNQACTVGK